MSKPDKNNKRRSLANDEYRCKNHQNTSKPTSTAHLKGHHPGPNPLYTRTQLKLINTRAKAQNRNLKDLNRTEKALDKSASFPDRDSTNTYGKNRPEHN